VNRNVDVDGDERASGKAGPGAPGSRIRTWRMEEMSLWQPFGLALARSVRGVSGHVAVDVYDTAGQFAGMSRGRPGIFVLSLDATMAAATCLTWLKSVMGKVKTRLECRHIDAHG